MPLISMVDRWVPQTLSCTPLINPYMAITCIPHPKTLLRARILPIEEVRPRDLETLTLYSLYKEKFDVYGILISSTPLYKHQASSYLRYAKILLALVSLSYWRFFHLWFNLRRVFSWHQTGALYRFFTHLFSRYPISAYLDIQLTGNFCASSVGTLCKKNEWFAILLLLRQKSCMVLMQSMATINQEAEPIQCLWKTSANPCYYNQATHLVQSEVGATIDLEEWTTFQQPMWWMR